VGYTGSTGRLLIDKNMLKGVVHSKTVYSVIIHPHVVPNSNDFLLWNTKRDEPRQDVGD